MRILVIEDDPALQKVIAAVLQDEAYQVDGAETGDEGFLLAAQGIYDLLVLDIMLPGMNGLTILQQLRAKSIQTPVLLVTAKDSIEDRVTGLDVGADDYLTKPFAVEELLARIRAILRRQGKLNNEGELAYGPVSLRANAHDGYIAGKALKLTIKEYELLEFFLRNKEQILTREQIFDRVWGIDSDASSAVVDVYVHYLRKKFTAFGYDNLIHTVRGVGFMMKEKQAHV